MHFDRVDTIDTVDGIPIDLVTHRNAEGLIFAYHSPLTDGTIECKICASGVRVYLDAPES